MDNNEPYELNMLHENYVLLTRECNMKFSNEAIRYCSKHHLFTDMKTTIIFGMDRYLYA